MSEFYNKLNNLLAAKTPFVSVTVVDSNGSVPGETGSKMLVTESGWYHGTVGGGRLEKKAIEEAQRLLAEKQSTQNTKFVSWSLSKDVGMTCGGLVRLYFERHALTTWEIAVFGAGHVANALIKLLLTLDCHITCIDPRADWMDKLPESPKLTRRLQPDMPSEVAGIADGAFVLLITMGHATDSPILVEILKSRKFPYLGVIGSDAKRVRLVQDINAAGLPAELASEFHCPMGLPVGSNDPAEIAVSITAQLLQARDAQVNQPSRELEMDSSPKCNSIIVR